MIDLANGQIDRYQLRERIGAGGMARVYKAWDTSLERLVAIKILHEHLADDPTFKERFEREAKFVAGFNHPNIVQVYDFNVINRDDYPICYMVMSYIPGKTLREVMEDYHTRGELIPRERVLELVNDLTAALGYAHLRGMVHRDVKPGNILLNEQGSAILTDFGIARLVQSNRLTQEGISTGTPTYMSPEQASGQGGDMRSDLYSLGIIVYEMLAGRPPFDDESSLLVMLKHLNTQPPLLSEFINSNKYDSFLAKALAKNPDERFQTASEFAQAVRVTFSEIDHERTIILPSQPALAAVRPTVPLTTSAFKTISQKARENPRTSTAIFVAMLGAVALLVLLMFNSNIFRQFAAPDNGSPAAQTEVPSMTGSDQPYFASTFSSDDSSTHFWPTVSTEFITREFTPDGFYRVHNIRQFTAETSIFEFERDLQQRVDFDDRAARSIQSARQRLWDRVSVSGRK